jgi:solute carrier family 6 serotonin transporter-like protein 4
MVWITAIAPYVVMIILLIRGLMLDGWRDGVEFYLGVRDWSSILEFKVVLF